MSSIFQLGADGIYRCNAFVENFDWQTHGFGTRAGNPAADITLKQVHSATVLNARGLGNRSHEGDALITAEIGTSIGIRTADCVPILLLDSARRAVAAIHAGWRGTAGRIAERTVTGLQAAFGTDPGDVHAAIGPCIRSCCYEVGEEVAEQFDPSVHQRSPSNGKAKLHLANANRLQLEALGVPGNQIYDCGRCTACESDLFFSYRREPNDPGRMLAAICRSK